MWFFRKVFTSISTASVLCTSSGAYSLLNAALVPEIKRKNCVSKYDDNFRRFASREYRGVLYMTPNDFLNSLFREKPLNLHFQSLSSADVNHLMSNARPSISTRYFRNLGNRGLISYTDYIFLLGLLNEPVSRFEVIFDVLDTNCSESIDVEEFSLLYKVTSGVPEPDGTAPNELSLYPQGDPCNQSTIMQSFFGKDGKRQLKKKDFYQFIENLQHEVLEVEFCLYSSNGSTISPTEFARVLLQNTNLPESQYDEFLSRLAHLPLDIEINLDDFKKFYTFFNYLDDFQVAMKMYLLANKPISLQEFKRAIQVCANVDIGEHVLQTLFCMFDTNFDGFISPKEFMVLLRSRRPRGIQKGAKVDDGVWTGYKKCVSRAIREP